MGKDFGKPRALTVKEIKEIVEQFAYAAEIAHRTGSVTNIAGLNPGAILTDISGLMVYKCMERMGTLLLSFYPQ
jgi:hypothetical protein